MAHRVRAPCAEAQAEGEVSARYLLDWIQYVDSRGASAVLVLMWGREDAWPMWRSLLAYRPTP